VESGYPAVSLLGCRLAETAERPTRTPGLHSRLAPGRPTRDTRLHASEREREREGERERERPTRDTRLHATEDAVDLPCGL
jgi:hypothetical protein